MRNRGDWCLAHEERVSPSVFFVSISLYGPGLVHPTWPFNAPCDDGVFHLCSIAARLRLESLLHSLDLLPGGQLWTSMSWSG